MITAIVNAANSARPSCAQVDRIVIQVREYLVIIRNFPYIRIAFSLASSYQERRETEAAGRESRSEEQEMKTSATVIQLAPRRAIASSVSIHASVLAPKASCMQFAFSFVWGSLRFGFFIACGILFSLLVILSVPRPNIDDC